MNTETKFYYSMIYSTRFVYTGGKGVEGKPYFSTAT